MEKLKLNIQLFASGTIEFDNWSSGSAIRGKIEWSSTPDINNNRSNVSANIYVRRTSGTTTGRQWNGYVNIDGNNHTFSQIYTGSSTSVGTSWVLVEYFSDTITHNTDGTKSITISGEVYGPSGTSLSGKSSWGSGTAVLDTLHKSPSDITYTMVETNPLLISAGVSNDLIVENLSIKQFDISYTLHDGATMTKLGIYNRIYPFSSTSTPFNVDLRQNSFVKWTNDETKIPIVAFVQDSMYSQGTSSDGNHPDLYNYITYTPISLTETSTIAKRDGQISGKVNLSINGTYFTGTIGNVSQATYKPVIKYKFWRSDATEPSTYAYTIPSSNITISNGTFSVSNYAIGSTSESATNYFNPDYSYRIKVQVDDNFSTYYSVEKSVPVGEATWTEYPDHVDFKAITIGGSPIIETNKTSNGGYVKYADGTIIQWKNVTATIGGTSWGSVGYSDHHMGDWLIPFTNIFYAWSSIDALQNWTTCEYWNSTSAGDIRAFRPNTGTRDATVTVTGIGKWK